MVAGIPNVATGTDGTSQAATAVSLRVLRKALDSELLVTQQMVNMVAQSPVYDAKAHMINTSSQRTVDIVV